MSARWREAHATIGRAAIAIHAGQWGDIDPTEDSELYDLRFTLLHLEAAELDREARQLRRDPDYAAACLAAADEALAEDRLEIALTLYEQAVGIYRCCVEEEGWLGLAGSLGAALAALGDTLALYAEADACIDCYEDERRVRRRLAADENRASVHALAASLHRQGDTLAYTFSQLDKAKERYAEAARILRPLAEREGPSAIAIELARALCAQANAQYWLNEWDDASIGYDEAIRWLDACVRAGMRHLLPEMLHASRARVEILLDLGWWDEAFREIERALHAIAPLNRISPLTEAVDQALGALIGVLRALPPETRTALYDALGERAGPLRELLENDEKPKI